jgi:uncharacterized membrane protein YgdD (TMEM256/DUF423 family)
LAVGAAVVALAVAAGAFGAHALWDRLDPHQLALWETAARYLVIAGFGLIGNGLAAMRAPTRRWRPAGVMLLAGGLIFSVTVGALALGAPSWLGAVTPLGGVLLIGGFLALAWAALRPE